MIIVQQSTIAPNSAWPLSSQGLIGFVGTLATVTAFPSIESIRSPGFEGLASNLKVEDHRITWVESCPADCLPPDFSANPPLGHGGAIDGQSGNSEILAVFNQGNAGLAWLTWVTGTTPQHLAVNWLERSPWCAHHDSGMTEVDWLKAGGKRSQPEAAAVDGSPATLVKRHEDFARAATPDHLRHVRWKFARLIGESRIFVRDSVPAAEKDSPTGGFGSALCLRNFLTACPAPTDVSGPEIPLITLSFSATLIMKSDGHDHHFAARHLAC